jgi:hypothetical protein
VLLVHEAALVRAQRRPDFDLIFVLAPQQQFNRTARDTMHTAHRVAGNERFVAAVRHGHSGMELLEVFRQPVRGQIFQHLGVELQHIPSRRDAWMALKSVSPDKQS